MLSDENEALMYINHEQKYTCFGNRIAEYDKPVAQTLLFLLCDYIISMYLCMYHINLSKFLL